MAKTRRKTSAIVSRGKDSLHIPIPNEPTHDNSIVLGLQAIISNVNPCASYSDPSPLSLSKLSPSYPDVLPTITEISSSPKLVDTVTVDYCSEDEALVLAACRDVPAAVADSGHRPRDPLQVVGRVGASYLRRGHGAFIFRSRAKVLAAAARLSTWHDVTATAAVAHARKLEAWPTCLVWIAELGDCEESSMLAWVGH
uniref:Uncharacterized protein n=1 Tax=Populus alba TaxID=43335 RepID=A0A4U5Q8P3_POPAL|nr:hypothetical protein D5086_0000120880 [Populus alba]